jgi:demethylmenaquinone methyltransferase / 2-methoxy-6-polyprenyl-1,4-benzoquinol methylase
VRGASPTGTADPDAASQQVREMFSAIAPRYDLLNHVLSCNVDRLWWWRTARAFAEILQNPLANVLDLCCGTCDMTLALRRRASRSSKTSLPHYATSDPRAIFAADFARPMLQRALPKIAGKNIVLLEADALRLPFAGDRFDLVVSAFGFRNLADYESGWREIYRVLRPGGEVGILEFSEPGGILGAIYKIYFRRVLPAIGSRISGVRQAYAYLPASVTRFPQPPEMLRRMQHAGFREVSWTPYSWGIARLFRGKK